MTDEQDRVDRSLAGLTRAPLSAPWREPGQLKRLAARRRRTRWTAAAAAGVAAAIAITLAVVLPGGSSGPVPPTRVAAGQHVAARSGIAAQLVADARPPAGTGTAAEAAVAKAEQAFTLALLTQADTAGATGNVVLSPSSLATALAMLQSGAAGRTERQIAATLRTSALSAKQQDAGWAALSADLAAAGAKDGMTVQSANSLWLQQNLPMAPGFMTTMARYFRTGVWQVDFAHHLTGAQQALNAWVTKQTHGKITSLFKPGDLSPQTVLVLANAVYFKARWKYQFLSRLTEEGTFSTGDGNTSTVPFMTYGPGDHSPALPFASTGDYDAVQLPYTGGRFAALAILPKGRTLTQFVEGLTPHGLARITGSLHTGQVALKLPRFTLSRYTNLNSTLSAMGMPSAFGPSADFSAMSPVGLRVQTVVQRSYLKVDEHGTEAAAVTGIGMVPTSTRATAQITFDHPFLFLLRDTKTGAVLFAAQVQNPAG